MIKAKKGHVKLKGRIVDLLADFALIAEAMADRLGEELPREPLKALMLDAVETAFLNEEERDKKRMMDVMRLITGLADEFDKEEESDEHEE